jgi:hypothetical protein
VEQSETDRTKTLMIHTCLNPRLSTKSHGQS